MIGKITVRLASENQNIPLKEIVQYRNSESSLLIENIPDLVGSWKVTGISVKISYPDNLIITKIASKVGEYYVVTIPLCEVVGSGKYLINALVITETGDIVNDFVLGCGNIIIADVDMTPIPEDTKYRMNLVDNISCESKGNFFANDISACVYDGNRWISIKSESLSLSGYATKDDLSSLSTALENDIPTKVSQLENDVGYLTEHQSLSGYATEEYVNNVSTSIINLIPLSTSELVNDSGYITKHQSLSDYYTKTETDTLISSKIDDAVYGKTIEREYIIFRDDEDYGSSDEGDYPNAYHGGFKLIKMSNSWWKCDNAFNWTNLRWYSREEAERGVAGADWEIVDLVYRNGLPVIYDYYYEGELCRIIQLSADVKTYRDWNKVYKRDVYYDYHFQYIPEKQFKVASLEWVKEQGYLSAHQSLTNYYSKTDLSVVILSGEFDDEIGGTFSLSILTLI